KWQQSARSLHALLYYMSGGANPDGTFIDKKNGIEIDFSPRYEKLCKRFAKTSLWRQEDKLRELGVLSWTRDRHYFNRSYVIHMDVVRGKQVPHSQKTGSVFAQEQVSDSQEEVSDSPKTGSMLKPDNRFH